MRTSDIHSFRLFTGVPNSIQFGFADSGSLGHKRTKLRFDLREG